VTRRFTECWSIFATKASRAATSRYWLKRSRALSSVPARFQSVSAQKRFYFCDCVWGL